ncbi:MAG: hypothetical protein ACR2N2_07730 [Acidimicrobiia bacterium]
MTDGQAFEPTHSDVRPFRVLDTRRRRNAGLVYAAMAVVAALLTLAAGVSEMWVTAVGVLALLAGLQFISAWKMTVTDMDAIRIASAETSFAVGHGSATLGYRGLLAKPVWQILVFADTPSPDHQALVTVDAMTGEVTGLYEEPVDAP